jgi:DNA-binding NtrC family response regulator
MAKIIAIDDDKNWLNILTLILKNANHEVFPLESGEKIIEEIKKHTPDIVMIDTMMPGISGGAVYQIIRKEIGYHIPIIICSVSKLKISQFKDTLLAYCLKPVNNENLLQTIQKLLNEAKDKEKNDG